MNLVRGSKCSLTSIFLTTHSTANTKNCVLFIWAVRQKDNFRRKEFMEFKKILTTLVFTGLFLLPILSFAGPLEKGSAALKQKNYKKAHSLLLPLAKKGNALAQYNIGVMYAQGLGVRKNEKQAVQWYLKAAKQGDPDAQSNLGLMYETGKGVNKDFRKAMEWYLRSAKQGNSVAQNNIGSLYLKGNGVKKSYKKALKWFSKAAANGSPHAQNSLGGMYVKGLGVKKNINKGLEWQMKAAQQGLPTAQQNVFMTYYNMARQGNPGAMHNMATMCLKGWAGKQDPRGCLSWYEKAANKGTDASRGALAKIYEKGLFGIAANEQKANYWKAQIGKKAKQ